MIITLIEKEQDWESETTFYWFDVDGVVYGLTDNNGQLNVYHLYCTSASVDASVTEALSKEYLKYIND